MTLLKVLIVLFLSFFLVLIKQVVVDRKNVEKINSVNFYFYFIGFSKYVWSHYKYWFQLIETVVHAKKPFLMIFYDDLKTEPVKQLKLIAHFLLNNNLYKIENLDEKLLCLSQNVKGRAKRTSRKNLIDPLSKEMKKKINKEISSARKFLKDKVIENIPMYER